MESGDGRSADLICVVYASAAAEYLRAAEFEALVESSRSKNSVRAITGVLLYSDGNFMQAIEGPRERVSTLQETIYADPRHHRILTMLVESIPERIFPDSPLAAPALTGDGRLELDAFLTALEARARSTPTTSAASRVLTLLLSFRRIVR